MKKVFNAKLALKAIPTIPFATYLRKYFGVSFLSHYSDKKKNGRRVKFYGLHGCSLECIENNFNKIIEYARIWYGQNIKIELLGRERKFYPSLCSIVIFVPNNPIY